MAHDYSPTVKEDGIFDYGYVPPFDPIFNGVSLAGRNYSVIGNDAIAFLLEEFEFHTKNVIGHRMACSYWSNLLRCQGIPCTNRDIEDAYTIAYGHGCEYEWEYE